MAQKSVLIPENIYFPFLSRINLLRMMKFYEIDLGTVNDCNGKSVPQIYWLRAENEARFGATLKVNIVQQSNALRARCSMCLLNVIAMDGNMAYNVRIHNTQYFTRFEINVDFLPLFHFSLWFYSLSDWPNPINRIQTYFMHCSIIMYGALERSHFDSLNQKQTHQIPFNAF